MEEMLLGNSVDPLVLGLLIAWTLPWKGVALWKASRLSHRGWFVAIFLLNTLAILDIYYIFFVASKYTVETEEVESKGDPASGE